MQAVEKFLEHTAQVIRPVQVDHHLEPDAMRGSEQYLVGPLAPRDSEGKPIPILNAEAARVDMLRAQQTAGQPLTPRAPGAGEILGHALPEEALTSATGDAPKLSVESPPVATDANGKPLTLPGQRPGEPVWMAQARAAGWTPSEPEWMAQARAAGWNVAGSGPIAPGSTTANAQPGQPVQNLGALQPQATATTPEDQPPSTTAEHVATQNTDSPPKASTPA